MNARVLLIDGDAGWARSIAERLQDLRPKLAVETCRSAMDALRAAQDPPVTLAVSNLVLPRPGTGGASTLARIRELYPSCRTVLISEQEALGGLLARASDALFSPRDVEEWIDYVLDVADKAAAIAEGSRDLSTVVFPSGPSAGSQPLFAGGRSPTSEKLIGGKYHPIELIGQGGMGEVWRAEDTFIQRPVALKLMQVPKTADPEEMRQRMRREVIIAGRLSHPHFVTVYDAGLEGRDVYLVMELVAGPTLADALKEDGPFEAAKAVAICQQILDALSLAHGLGFIHRDLKPSNVLMASRETVKIADLGLAKLFRAGDETPPMLLKSDLTLTEYAVGTPPYMAPEQLRCEPTDARTDLYAVGLLLFEMLHGLSLAHFLKPLDRARAVVESKFDKPLPVLPGEPKVQRVLEKALALEPAQRYQDAKTFAQALDVARSSWQQHLPRLFPRRGDS